MLLQASLYLPCKRKVRGTLKAGEFMYFRSMVSSIWAHAQPDRVHNGTLENSHT